MVKDSENVVTLDYDYGQYYEKKLLIKIGCLG